MQSEIDCGSINGSAIRIIHDNKIIYEDELGYANKEKGMPTQKDTLYRLYSMSKPITAVAVMILYERGILDLLAPVSDYLEGFQNQKVWTDEGLVDVKRPVTIQDMLNMTSGVLYPDQNSEVGRMMEALYEEATRQWNSGAPVSTVDLCNQIGRLPLDFQPGEKWCYGTSAEILGAVIEVASGKKFSQFLQEEIFTPLGMVDTGFNVPQEKIGRLALMYEYIEEHKQLEPCIWSQLGIGNLVPPQDFESGGGGLVSSVEDYSRFALMLANGGTYNNVRILGTKTVEYMTKPQIDVDLIATNFDCGQDSRRGYSYGNLMRNMIDPVKAESNGSVGEYGWDGWAGNYFFVDPKEKVIMICMIQKCGGFDSCQKYIRKLRSIIYSALN